MGTPKEAQLNSWTNVSPGWKKHDAWLVESSRPCTQRILERAKVGPGGRVLDIASGTGEPAIPAAHLVGPHGFVLGTDFVEPMLAFAREKAAKAGLRNLEFRCVDGESLQEPDASFDAATMRWGLMFMPDGPACLRAVARALKPGSRVALSCWAAPEQNPWASIPAKVMVRNGFISPPPPGAPGLFAYADPKRLDAELTAAGFRDVGVEPVELVMVSTETAEAYWDYVRELAGPLASAFAKLTLEQQRTVTSEILAEAKRASPGGRIVLKGLTWVASGRA